MLVQGAEIIANITVRVPDYDNTTVDGINPALPIIRNIP